MKFIQQSRSNCIYGIRSQVSVTLCTCRVSVRSLAASAEQIIAKSRSFVANVSYSIGQGSCQILLRLWSKGRVDYLECILSGPCPNLPLSRIRDDARFNWNKLATSRKRNFARMHQPKSDFSMAISKEPWTRPSKLRKPLAAEGDDECTITRKEACPKREPCGTSFGSATSAS